MAGQLLKTLVIGTVAGVVGGGALLGGQLLYDQSQNQATTAQTQKQTTTDTNQKGTATTAYHEVADAVVSILNYQRTGQDTYTEQSEGSGVIYNKTGDVAYVVTNNHVIEGANAIQVLLNDGKKVDATIVGQDEMTDLAVLKMSAKDVTKTAEFADSGKIVVGQQVLAIGSPLGSEYASSVTQGIISATTRLVETATTSGQNYGGSTVIQTDAAINPGNSGGPLVNLAGQVVGINSMKLASSSSGTSVEGMGFAIPANTVVDIVNGLIQDGKITRPAIGIGLVNLTDVTADDQRNILKLPDDVTGGVVVMSLTEGGPADTAKMKKYDVIVGINGKEVKSQANLREELYRHELGDTVTLTYYRGDQKHDVKVKLTQKLES